MKNKFSYLIPGIVAACSFMVLGPVTTQAATSYFEVAQEQVPVYDNRTGALVEVGNLEQGQDFKVKSDWGNWLQIDFGGYNGYVAKAKTDELSSASYKNVNTKFQHTNQYITTVKDAPVFDNTSGELVQYATIKEGQKYPILFVMDNWFGVDIDGRVGYIHNTAAKLNTATQSNPIQNAATPSKTTTTNAIYHTVQSGETLYRISVKYGVSTSAIQSQNKLSGTSINVGQKLLIKPGTTQTITSPVSKPQVVKTYIRAIEDAPLYDTRRGTLDEIGKLLKGQELEVVSDYGANWYQVKWGNTYAYVAKSTVETNHTQDFKNVNPAYKTTNRHIIPVYDDTPIYDNTSGALIPFATLEENHRYPYVANIGGWWIIDLGGRYGYVHQTKVKFDEGVPVLMYHHILDARELGNYKGNSTTITTEQFSKEMAYLNSQGFETITMADLEKFVAGKINLPAKTVAITFDDGLLSVRDNAYPIMNQYGMKATQYMITARNYDYPLGQVFNPTRLQYFSKQDMFAMSNVFDYQAHTHNLHNLNSKNQPDLLTKPYSILKADIQLNKNILNAHSFAYPFGLYNTNNINLLKELGFTNAVTTKTGYVNVGDDPYQLKRFGVYQHTSLYDFMNIVN